MKEKTSGAVGNCVENVGNFAHNVGNLPENVGNFAKMLPKNSREDFSHIRKKPKGFFLNYLWLSNKKMWAEIHKMWETLRNPESVECCNGRISAVPKEKHKQRLREMWKTAP